MFTTCSYKTVYFPTICMSFPFPIGTNAMLCQMKDEFCLLSCLILEAIS